MTISIYYTALNLGTLPVTSSVGRFDSGRHLVTSTGEFSFYRNSIDGTVRAIHWHLNSSGLISHNILFNVEKNQNESGHRTQFDFDKLNNGNIVFAWSSNSNPDNVEYAIFDSNMNQVSQTFLAENSGMISTNPSVSALAGGGFVIAWQRVIDSQNSDIMYRRFDNNGVSLGDSAFGVSADESLLTFDELPSVVGLSDGNFAISYQREHLGRTEIISFIRGAGGESIFPVSVIDSVGTINRGVNSVSDLNGGYFLIYENSPFPDNLNNTNVSTIRISQYGNVISPVRYVSEFVGMDTNIDVDSSIDGYMFTSQTQIGSLGDQNLSGSLIDVNGIALIKDIPVYSGSGNQYQSSVEWVNSSSVWITYTNDLSNIDTDTKIDSTSFYIRRFSIGDQNNSIFDFSNNGIANNIESGMGQDVIWGGHFHDTINSGGDSDLVFGGAGNDYIVDGGGPAGSEDTLFGGTGNDTYEIGVLGTSVVEFPGEGGDGVRTTFSIYQLQDNVENLQLIDNGNHAAGVGNVLDNYISGGTGVDDLFGRDGSDTLVGGQGAANTLVGQGGSDTYVVEAIGDSVIEFAGEGNDTVRTALGSFVLRDNVENLTYTGTTSFIGLGAGDANVITGGIADDQLNGLGGDDILIGRSGADLLQGGSGADRFRYDGGETGLDRVLDFVSGTDKIALSSTGFTHTAAVDFNQSGAPVATSTNSTFLYNVNNGIISYDADGTGAGAAVQIAQLNAGLTLAATDFIFY